MNNQKISSLQFSCLLIYPILSLFSGSGFYDILKIAGLNSYLSIIIATILGIFILLLFLFIFNYKPDMAIYDKNIYLFGKILGNIINYLINILIIIIGVVSAYSISNFIVSQFLSETPIYIILLMLGFTTYYSVSKGIEVIARISVIFFIIIFLLTIISTLGLIPNFKLDNLKPVLEDGMKMPVIASLSFCLTNIVPIMIILIIPKNNIIDKEVCVKYIFIAYAISMLFTFLAVILTIGTLGIELLKIFPYPEYMVLKKISILGFIDRIENFIYIKWMLNDVVSISLIVYYICNSIKARDKQKLLPFVVILVILVLSQLLFKDNTEFKWFVKNIYPYLNLALLGIFVAIFINILVRKMIKEEDSFS